MRIGLKSNISRYALILSEVAIFIAVGVLLARITAADAISRQPSVASLERAIRLDPRNAESHLRLGRLFQYSPASIDPQMSLERFRRAVRLSPYDPQPWLELGAAFELQGKIGAAEACLHRADSLAPHIPSVQWAVGNFFLLHGNVDEAFPHFKVVLAGSSEYNQILFRTAWKASGDADRILRELIPEHLSTEFDYLYYLVSQDRYPEALRVWKRLTARPETFPASRVSKYIDVLIQTRRPTEAYQVWEDLGAMGIVRNLGREKNGNLLRNGDFEGEFLNLGFDWRITQVDGAYASLDQSTFRSASRSCRIRFFGTQNLYYRNVSRYVRVNPGRPYRITAFAKTQGITTDSGPRLEVSDAYDPAALRVFSEDLTGSSLGWIPITVQFRTGPKTELIVLQISRLPSQKFDNLIKGDVWIDDVSLPPSEGKTGQRD